MRVLRIVGIALGCLIAVVIVALIAIRLLVNPNDYKGRIEAAVKSSTGRDLSLTGDIRLSVFPWIAVELGPASLGNPPGFGSQPFASVQRASLRVRLLPLLHKQLDVGRVEVDGLDLRLLENAQGQGNWVLSGNGAAKTTTGNPNAAGSTVRLGGIAGVVVKDSRVSYQGMVADQVSMDLGHVAQGVPIPFKWNLALTTSPGARPIPITGDATLEYGASTARVSGLDARLDDSTLRGNAAVANLATGAITFDLSLDRIDLDRYLKAGGAPKGAPQAAAEDQARKPAQPIELPVDLVKALRVNGKLAIGSATVDGIKLTQVAVGVADDGGTLRIAPAAAKLYGGNYSGTVTLDARGAVPVLQLDQRLAGVEVGPLLEDFAKIKRLSGRGNVTMNVTGRGRTTDDLLKTLDGHAAADLASGAIEGIDLWSALGSAVSLVEQHKMPAGQASGSTKFDAFKATADIADGVASTKDLDIASGDLRVTGQGTTNLVTGAVDYRVSATVLKSAATQGASAGTLASVPLLVSGTLTSPSVRPDTQALAKSFAQQQIQKHKGAVQQKLQSALKGLFR